MYHHPPVQRSGLGPAEHELLELHAEGWSSPVIASMLGLAPTEIAARLRALCAVLGVAPREDGTPSVTAARMWLVEEARRDGGVAAA
jgi:DNA-binding NarL/FixJ family response regulator